MDDLIYRQAAIDALLHNQEVYSNNFGTDAIDKYTTAIIANDVETIAQLPSAQPERKTGEWIPCKTPPNDGRSVFIAYGSGGLGTVCIGYYDPDDKCWREHKNWFASLLSGVKYWCEIPELPDGWKEEDDGRLD